MSFSLTTSHASSSSDEVSRDRQRECFGIALSRGGKGRSLDWNIIYARTRWEIPERFRLFLSGNYRWVRSIDARSREAIFFYLRSVYVFLRHTEVFIGRWMRLAFSLSKTEKNFFIASAMKRVGAKYFGRCSFISIFVYLVEGKAWSKGNNYFPPVSLACCARLFLGNGHNGPYKSDPCQRPPSLRDLSKLPCSLPAWTPYLEECASSIYRWNVLLKGSDRQGVEARQVYLKRVRGSQV